MTDYSATNKKWWNNVTPIHVSSKLYNLDAFTKGTSSLQQIEIQELTDVSEKTLLHLMCHFGMDTLSWARKGAIATGVDISDEAITTAKDLSKEIRIPAKFICSDLYTLEKKLDQQFDIVFTSYGVLLWLPDLEKWAKIVCRFLKKGGTFYMVETHPFTNMLTSDMKLTLNYFDKGPYIDDASGTYVDWDANIKGKTYVWLHTIGDIITSLTNAGLTIEYVHEFPFTTYDQFPGYMKQTKEGTFVLRKKIFNIPLLFSLKAKK